MTADLSQLVKAYDVRGVVPDQWDESLAELFGAAFVQVTGADAIVIGHDMRPSSPGLSRAFARGAAARGVDVTEIGLCSTDQLYYASGAFDLPGAMFTASHNPAQYNGIKMCRAGAAPVGQDTGLSEIRELVESWIDSGAPHLGRDTGNDHAAGHVGGLRGAPPRPRRPDLHPPPEGRRRRGQRHGRAHGPDRLRRPAPRPSSRCTSSWTAPSRTTRRTRSTRRTSSTSRSASARRAPTSASPSTATPTAASSSTSSGEPVSPSAITALVAARELAKHGGGHGHPQPDHLLVGARGRPGERRHPGPHPRRPLLHQGRDGHVRRDLRRRALRALLLPRLLERGHGHARRPPRPRRPRRPGRPALRPRRPVRPLRRLRRDQLHGRRPDGPPRRDQGRLRGPRGHHPRRTRRPHRHRRPTGGSTSAPPTRNRCCASTRRRGTRRRWRRCGTRSLEIIRG